MHSRSDRAAILSPKRLLMGSALFSAFAFAPAVQAQSVPDPSQSDAASPMQDAPSQGVGDIVVRSEEHTSELQSLMRISYAVFCLKKKNNTRTQNITSKK